ncbi:MAG: AI-2E family transporter [Thomasclavelia sp.]|nr:AI-2E family transporter [Thomasclavelia sp.]
MKFLKAFISFLSNKRITQTLINILILLVIIFMLIATSDLWIGIVNLFWLIIKPFLIGFVIAFVFNPLIEYLYKKIKNRGACVAIVYVGVIALLIALVALAIPSLYSSVSTMFPTLKSGLVAISKFIYAHFNFDISSLTGNITSEISKFIQSETTVNSTISILNDVMSTLGNTVIYIVLAIYISLTWRRIRDLIKYYAGKIDQSLPSYLKEINYSLIAYVKAFAIGAVVQAITTMIMYLIIGHPNWMFLGIISGISSIIPYIGPIAANCLGLVTTLSLGPEYCIILLLLMFIQSTLVTYVIQPKIYSHQIGLSIMAVLFGILTGSTLFGPIGMVIAMPLLVTIKIVVEVYRCHHPIDY